MAKKESKVAVAEKFVLAKDVKEGDVLKAVQGGARVTILKKLLDGKVVALFENLNKRGHVVASSQKVLGKEHKLLA